MLRLSIIVAATLKNGIGKDGKLPWHIHDDLRYFAHVTQHAPEGAQNAVIMGRKTWESIPAAHRPLSKRYNIVVSNDTGYNLNAAPEAGRVVESLDAALAETRSKPIHRAFVIGGASLYEKVLHPTAEAEVDRILITRVLEPEFECDTTMPDFTQYGKWKRASHQELVDWVGFDVKEGPQVQAGKDGEASIKYEYQMWTLIEEPTV